MKKSQPGKEPDLFAENEGSKTISFRVDLATYERLVKQAALGEKTVGQFAKESTLQSLEQIVAPEDLKGRMEEFERHLVALRSDLIRSVQILLAYGGRFSPDDARKWVEKKLLNTE